MPSLPNRRRRHRLPDTGRAYARGFGFGVGGTKLATTTKKSARRAAKKIERQRRVAIAARSPLRPGRPSRGMEPPYPFPDDLDGGAGVREPRRPMPGRPSGAMELEFETPQQLDVLR